MRLDHSQESLDKFNWFLGDGWAVVDRFDFHEFMIIMFKHD